MLHNNLQNLIYAFWGGASIAIGSLLYLNVGGICGALGFSIGLYLILWFKLHLYTGKIGYISKPIDAANLFFILLGNIIGCFVCFIVQPHPIAIQLITTKLEANLFIVFIKAVLCGILIYAAVEQYKLGISYAPIIAVPAFILCGAEHCIADICFFIAAGDWRLDFIPFIFIVIFGNSVGSILFRLTLRKNIGIIK